MTTIELCELCCVPLIEAVRDEVVDYDPVARDWNVAGCSQCYVLKKIERCPFCGTKLPTYPTIEGQVSTQNELSGP